jgi:alpha-tubulin suppressor-like RCC1 family protein
MLYILGAQNNNACDPISSSINPYYAYHHGTEIWYAAGNYRSNKMCDYRECTHDPTGIGEDYSCSDHLDVIDFVLGLPDHSGYWDIVPPKSDLGFCGLPPAHGHPTEQEGTKKCPSSAWATGFNVRGQLGIGTFTDVDVPVGVRDGLLVVEISAGGYHSLFRTTTGEAWACGDNLYGQLGNGESGEETNQPTPVQVTSLGQRVAEISAGAWHSLFRTTTGEAWACGSNFDGQLGNGDTAYKYTPVQVTSLGQRVAEISAGAWHSLFRTTTGEAWACGNNLYGQLGNGESGEETNQPMPVQVTSLGQRVAEISAGESHSLFLTTAGEAYACGENWQGQLGNGGNGTMQAIPVQVTSLGQRVAEISAGGVHSLFRTTTGEAWACGSNFYGQLGTGDTAYKYTPVQVTSLGQRVAEISAGASHSLFRTTTGEAWACGSSIYGQLGNGESGEVLVSPCLCLCPCLPTPVQVLSLGQNVTEISAGHGVHSLFRITAGEA